MKRIVRPIKRISQDQVYRNFIRQEYRRRLLAHKGKEEPETEEEAGGEERGSEAGQLFHAVISHKLISVPLIIVGILAVLLFTRQVVNIIAFSILLLLASFSTVYKRKLGLPLGGIELVTFGTVITAIAFNPIAGIIFGIISSLASEIISANIGPLTWIYIINMAVVGFLAGIFSDFNIVAIGMAATFLVLLVNQALYFVVGDEEIKTMTAFYMISNTVFNFILFTTIAGRVLSVIVY